MELNVPNVLTIGKARNYVLRHWTGLTRFLEDGRIPIDNNASQANLAELLGLRFFARIPN